MDERFDPEKSTRAYARYMKLLYDQFGDWYLAMAAYDWGAGNVQRAVEQTGYADFWELYKRNNLPAETKNYVPIILAAAVMAKNPEQYGLTTWRRSAGGRRYGDRKRFHRPSAGRGHRQCAGAADRRTQSEPVAHDDATRRAVRFASADRHEG